MVAILKDLSKHSAIYGISTVLNKALAFFLLPVYTRYLTPADYGVLEILVVSSTFLILVLKMGIDSAMFASVLHGSKHDDRTLFSTAFYFLAGFSVLLLCPFYAFAEEISRLILGVAEYGYLLRIIFVSVFLEVILLVSLTRYRIRNESVRYACFTLSKFFVQLLLNIYFIVVARKGVEGLVWATLITSCLFCVVLTCTLFGELGWTFSLKALKEMLAFGLPLVPAGVAAIILTMSDRYFLRYYADCTEVGLYSLGYKLATVVSLIVGAFQTAWPAVLFSTAKKKKAPSIFSELFTYFFFFLMFLAVSISVLAKEIVALMATSVFHTGYRVVPLIALSYVLYGCYHMTAVGVNVKRKTYYIPFVMGGAALLNLLLNYLLIPRYGMMGAAEATVISYMFMVMVAAKISLHLYHVPYEYVRIGKILSVALIVYGLSLLVRTDRILLATMVKVILILGYPGLLYVMRFYRRAELMHIKEVVLRSIGREQGDKGR